MTTGSVRIHQAGPGDAERVASQLVLPDGTVTGWNEIQGPVTRGTEIGIGLGSDDGTQEGRYTLRVRYRCLPNTRTVRPWEISFDWTSGTG
jgi:hypothetical protein